MTVSGAASRNRSRPCTRSITLSITPITFEHDLFGQAAPAVELRGQYGPAVEGLAVEDRLKKLGETLLPLLDRANRLMVRNLRAMKDLRQGPTPAATVGQAQQVNVASQQVNAVGTD